MSHYDRFTWHVGSGSGVSASEVVGEVAEVVGKVAEVVGEIAEVVGEITEVVGEVAGVVGEVAEVVEEVRRGCRGPRRWRGLNFGMTSAWCHQS